MENVIHTEVTQGGIPGGIYNKPREFKNRNKDEEKDTRISNPIIDKIHILIELKDQDDVKNITKALLSENPENRLSKTIKRNTGRYPVSIVFHLPSNSLNDPVEKMWIGICPETKMLLLNYTPSKLSDHAYDLLNTEVFAVTRFSSFYNFISGGKVTRLDVCRNLFNVDIGNYLFRGSWFKNYGCYFGSDGKLETLYFGLLNGSRLAIYNKKKEDKKNYLRYHQVFRIERQIKSLGITVRDLHKFANPFGRAEIYSLDLSGIDCVPEVFQACFLDSCRARGFNNALNSLGLSEKEKSKALRQLKETAWPEWIEAQENWTGDWIRCLKEYSLYDANVNNLNAY